MRSPEVGGTGSVDALEWLFALQRFGVRPGLARMHALLAAIGSPQRSFDTVLVAGTNGKGSTSRVLAACLGAAGRRTGLFTSPHLQHVGERALVDGVATGEHALSVAVATVRPHAEVLGATFFEVVTAACLLLFADAGVEIAVMEVGLGGRLDATNALEPVLSVITGIALDHTDVLGANEASIAREKAGILRDGVPALTGATGRALSTIVEEARRIGAPLTVLGGDLHVRVTRSSWAGLELVVSGLGDDPEADLVLATPLVGRHQASNVALAVAGAVELGVRRAALVAAVGATTWPGRLERLSHEGRTVVLDGAHNPQAAAALVAAITELEGGCDVLVLGTSADKDHAGLVPPLVALARSVVVTRALGSPRATPPERLAAMVAEAPLPPGAARSGSPRPVTLATDPVEALALATALAPEGGLIVVAGSLFLVGEVRSAVLGSGRERFERWQ